MKELVARLLERPLVAPAEPVRGLDAIVVLGSPLGPGDSLTPVLAERANAAVGLFRAGGAPLIVATGGITHGARRAEADVLADAIRREVDVDVVVERGSQTTAQNARFTATILAERGAKSAWIVTQPFHTRRAVRLFREAGIDAHAWHIADSLEYRDRTRALRWCIREYVSWAALFVGKR
ncbi:MAG TPA: YdcF family protein [Kofleriaceae bacterium]|jgi:uncharacterized SAM-binding protein YcdF (DUF218 family)